MLVTYGVGALVVEEFFIEAVTVAMLSSLLLVLKRELHQFAWGSRGGGSQRGRVHDHRVRCLPAAPGGDHRPVGRGPAASHLVAGRRRQRHRLRQLRACKAVPGARLRGHRLLRWARELDRGRRRDGQTREGAGGLTRYRRRLDPARERRDGPPERRGRRRLRPRGRPDRGRAAGRNHGRGHPHRSVAQRLADDDGGGAHLAVQPPERADVRALFLPCSSSSRRAPSGRSALAGSSPRRSSRDSSPPGRRRPRPSRFWEPVR